MDLDAVVEAAVDAIWQHVPAYRENTHPELRADATQLNTDIHSAILACIADGRPLEPSDIPSTRAHAYKRVEQGISLADFLHAYRVAQLELWDAMAAAAIDAGVERDVAVAVARQVMQSIEVGSTVAAEAYLDAEANRLADSDRTRRDLLEDLLAGSPVPPGPKLACLRTAGLERPAGLVVLTAIPVGVPDREHSLRDVAQVLSRVAAPGARGIAVVRQHEVVAVVPAAHGVPSIPLQGWSREVGRLQRQNLPLAVGVSTIYPSLAGVPAAYAEACVARDGLHGAPGVLALPLLRPFEYLTLRGDETARRLIRPEVRQFVEEDFAREGSLIKTLSEYAACDLNAKVAATRLHLHVNTVYYRLERVAEKTGCDMRSITDMIELLIAIRLLGADSGPPTVSRDG